MKKDQKWSKAGGIWAGSCHRGQSPLKLSHIGLRTPCSLSITQITILTSLVLQCAQYHYFDRLLADRQHKRPKITNKLQCGRVVLPWSDLMKYFDQRLQFLECVSSGGAPTVWRRKWLRGLPGFSPGQQIVCDQLHAAQTALSPFSAGSSNAALTASVSNAS